MVHGGCQSWDSAMASYEIASPESFDFSKPKEWVKWSHGFKRFRKASDLICKQSIFRLIHSFI